MIRYFFIFVWVLLSQAGLAKSKTHFCEWELAWPKEKIVKSGFFLVRKSNCHIDGKFVFKLKEPNFFDKHLFGIEVRANEVPLNTGSDFLLVKLEKGLKDGGVYSFISLENGKFISEVSCCDSQTYESEEEKVKELYYSLVDDAEKNEAKKYWGKYFEKFQDFFPEVQECFFEDCLGISLKNAKTLGFEKNPQEKKKGQFLDQAFPKKEELKLHFLNKKRIKYYSKMLKKKFPYQTEERGLVLHRDYHSKEVEIRSRLHFIDRFMPSCGIATSINILKNSEDLIFRFIDRFGVKYDPERLKKLIKKKKEFGLAEIFRVSKRRTNKNLSKIKMRRMGKDSFRISFSSSLCGPL